VTDSTQTAGGTSAPSSQRNCTASNGASARVAMQGFVYGRTMTGIWSPAHASALISIFQLAGAHQNGLLGSLSHGHRTAWIIQNRSAFFRVGGPLAAYNELSVTVFMRHLSDAEAEAKTIYDCSHSNDPTGAEHEDVPPWARQFFRLFEVQNSQVSALAMANKIRRERTSVIRGIVGAQAPLGHSQGDGTAQLCNEISRNIGTAQQCQRRVGNINCIQQMNEDEMNEYRAEGVDDDANPRPAQRRCTSPRDGRARQIVNFSADWNDPVSRFAEIQYGFQSVGMLSNAIQQNMNAPLPEPRCTGRDVANDYEHASAQYHNALRSKDEMDIRFWNAR
jgi:hypothetical protein